MSPLNPKALPPGRRFLHRRRPLPPGMDDNDADLDAAAGHARAENPGTAARSRASSSSAAPPSHHPRTEGVVSRTYIRQSALYSNRPKNPRYRKVPLQTEEHRSEVSSSELGGDLATLEALSLSDPPPFTLQDSCDDHPQTVGALSRTRIRQSALYSNRPRRSRRRQVQLPTEGHPSEISSSAFGVAVTDLSLRDPPSLTLQISDDDTLEDSDDESSHICLQYSKRYPFIFTASWQTLQRGPRLHDDSEESKREIQQRIDALTPRTFEEGYDRIMAANRAELTALAAKLGIRDPFLVDEETLLTPHHASAEAAEPLARMTASQEEDNIKDGKKWMRDEVKLCFEKHVEKTAYLAGVDFELDELCHQCFHVDSYIKVFHHYNFKIRIKMPGSPTWTNEFYFGEVKEMFGRKFYFCYPLQPNESGRCYACKKQGVEDLRHPAIGGFENGDSPSNFFWRSDNGEELDYWWGSSDEDD